MDSLLVSEEEYRGAFMLDLPTDVKSFDALECQITLPGKRILMGGS